MRCPFVVLMIPTVCHMVSPKFLNHHRCPISFPACFDEGKSHLANSPPTAIELSYLPDHDHQHCAAVFATPRRMSHLTAPINGKSLVSSHNISPESQIWIRKHTNCQHEW